MSFRLKSFSSDLKKQSRKFAPILLATAFLAGSLTVSGQSAVAAVPKLDKVRVVLYVNHKSYSLIESTVSLASDKGYDLGVKNGSAVSTWLSIPEAGIRLSLDRYSVQLLETTDYVRAKSLFDKMNGFNDRAYLFSSPKQGATVYKVQYGRYSSASQASAAKDSLLSIASIAAAMNTDKPALIGPYRLNAGTFTTEADAVKQITALANAGITADLAVQSQSTGQVSYSAWVGGTSTAEELAAVKQAAVSAMPGLILQPVDISQQYLIRKTDVSDSPGGANGIAHYWANPNGQKTWIHPKQSGVQISEHFGRKYRGDLELSEFNGELALINELPFEEYLYSVVSTEMDASFPLEALKAQAVAARTYTLAMGNKYGIGHISDTTFDQAYYGIGREVAPAISAVNATQGELILDKNGAIITPFYSSNSGGITADPSEVWNGSVPYVWSAVKTPDEAAAKGKSEWVQVVLASGQVGFVSSTYLRNTGTKNAGGLTVYESTDSGVNVRNLPTTSGSTSLYQLKLGERVIALDRVMQSNEYSWIRIADGATLMSKLMGYGISGGTLNSLEVTKRGPSGRAIEVKANGQLVVVKNPDVYRTALGGLPSTLIDIEEAGRYTIIGAGGNKQAVQQSSQNAFVLSSAGKTPQPVSSDLIVLGADGKARPITKENKFIIHGKGFGHGLGMSQWGALGYAEQGYDYKKILQSYYNGISISKE
jgi:stage II sporulation protein D